MAMAIPVSRRFLAVLIVSLTLGACGGGDEKIPSAAEDQARAERMVLTEADLPGMTRGEEDDSDDADDPIRNCLDSPVTTGLGSGPRSAESTFNNEEETLLRSSAVNLAEREDDAKEAFAEVKAPAFLPCFEDAFRESFEDGIDEGVAATNLSVSNLDDAEHGDESVTYRVTLNLEVPGQTVPASFDYMFIREGRVVGVLFTFDLNNTIDDAERGRLAEILTDRMQDA